MKKHIKRALVSLVALVGVFALGPQAIAGTVYQGASGMPFNNAPLSNYTVTDGNACFTSSRIWVVRIPMPTASGTVTRNFSANYGNMQFPEMFSFTNGNTLFAGVSFTSLQNASISVPANGTVFARFIATSSTTLQACIRSVTFVS